MICECSISSLRMRASVAESTFSCAPRTQARPSARSSLFILDQDTVKRSGWSRGTAGPLMPSDQTLKPCPFCHGSSALEFRIVGRLDVHLENPGYPKWRFRIEGAKMRVLLTVLFGIGLAVPAETQTA